MGTDDGLVQVTEDGGKNWRKVDKPAGVPEDAYVQRIVASQHDAGTVYVAYENHQNGDFKPYLLRSEPTRARRGSTSPATCRSAAACYAIAEDHVNSKLLFAGTEFGLYFSNIGGEKWIKLNVGLPTIMVRDLAIQKQMDDLVIGTFGRSIYVLDDYSPLRLATAEMLQKDSAIFPVRNALSYLPYNPGGDLGTNHFTAPNPPVGAAITFNLKDAIRTKQQERQQRERAAIQRGETPPYPTPEELRAEAEEEAPAIVVSISDASGKVIRRFDAPATRGIHRVTGICERRRRRWLRRFRSVAARVVAAAAAGAVVAPAADLPGGAWRRRRRAVKRMSQGFRRPRRRSRNAGPARQVHGRAGQTSGRCDHAPGRLAGVRSGSRRSFDEGGSAGAGGVRGQTGRPAEGRDRDPGGRDRSRRAIVRDSPRHRRDPQSPGQAARGDAAAREELERHQRPR